MNEYWNEKLSEYNEEIEKLKHKYGVNDISIRNTLHDEFYVVAWFYTLNMVFSMKAETINNPFFLELLEHGLKQVAENESAN